MADLLNRDSRLKIFRQLSKDNMIWGDNPNFSKLDFLQSIWDLRLLASSDPRYKDACGDARQHLINNDDWDDEYTFLDRFKLLECSDKEFILFLNVVVSPESNLDDDNILSKVESIEAILPEDIQFKQSIDENGRVRYTIKDIAEHKDIEEEYPLNVKKNAITFIVDKDIDVYPRLYLESNTWDDFGFKTTFTLKYYTKKDSYTAIGRVKILNEKADTTWKIIPEQFVSLNDSFCSLGQDRSYYERLKRSFPDSYKSILFALKDAVYYPDIHQRNEGLLGFRNSLLRTTSAQEALLTAKRTLERGDLVDDWSFTFNAEIPYSEESIPIQLNFRNLEDEDNTSRIKAIIGPNGAGKTSVLKSLVSQLIRESNDQFTPYRPVFSKVIALSFSIFDTFINLRAKTILSYCYCGLHNNENSVMSEKERNARLIQSLKWINEDLKVNGGSHSLFKRFIRSLEIFFPEAMVESFIDDDKLHIKRIIEQSNTMSSGESMFLNLVASLYANIRTNTLIVFDEMEVHLHPKAIRNMMRLLFKITREFNSACLIATHSSIVVQELLADNVTIIEKDEDGQPNVRRLNHESLGENLSVISDEIFGEISVAPRYKKFIRTKAEESDSIDELLESIASNNLPPNLSLYMMARNAYESKKQ